MAQPSLAIRYSKIGISTALPTPVPTKMAFSTPKITGHPLARVANPASSAKVTTANRIEVSFLRVEIETGANTNSMAGTSTTIYAERKE